jgi:hypothetical protein
MFFIRACVRDPQTTDTLKSAIATGSFTTSLVKYSATTSVLHTASTDAFSLVFSSYQALNPPPSPGPSLVGQYNSNGNGNSGSVFYDDNVLDDVVTDVCFCDKMILAVSTSNINSNSSIYIKSNVISNSSMDGFSNVASGLHFLIYHISICRIRERSVSTPL